MIHFARKCRIANQKKWIKNSLEEITYVLTSKYKLGQLKYHDYYVFNTVQFKIN